MRYNILYPVVLLLILTGTHGMAQCVNGTETNPIAPLPAGAGFKTNTFNWQQTKIPITGKFLQEATVNSPFHSTASYLEALQGGFESDSKPSDGWQLIKQEFGYAYLNNSWQGQTLFNATNANQTGRAYMMLYNKYSGVLRILGLQGNVPASSQIVVVLSLKPKRRDRSNQIDFEFNALFNRYNKQETALDLTTKVTSVTAAAQAPGVGSEFFYADFNLSYDPCICFFKSALEVNFQIKQTSTLQLTGRILGQSVDIANQNALPKPDYLTSVWNNNVPNQPYNQQYSSLSALQTKLQNQVPTLGGKLLNLVSTLAKGAKIAKSYNPAIGALGSAFSGLAITEADKIGKLTSFFDFLSFFTGSDGKSSNPSVITAELAAVGKITSIAPVNGSDFLVGMPGSKDAALLPEYPISLPPSQGIKPMYPMYNEMPGKFAIVKTPEILFFDEQRPRGSDGPRIGTVTVKLNDVFPTLSYAFNPIVDAANTKVFVALELVNKQGEDFINETISRFLPIENSRNIFISEDYEREWEYFSEENFNVVFQIFYQFKPDANGEIKVGLDIIKMKPKITFSTSNLRSDPRFVILSNTPTDLNISNTTFTQGQTIYSFGDITITGNLTNNSSVPIIIIAQGDINVNSGVNIVGNIEFRSGQVLPPGFPSDPPLPPMSASEIQTFCTTSAYKAKDATFKADTDTPGDAYVKGVKGKTFDFNISPNPFSNEITVDFMAESETSMSIDLANALGQTVKSLNFGTKGKGSYQETIETPDLAPGVYFLTLRTQNGSETKKIVKQ